MNKTLFYVIFLFIQIFAQYKGQNSYLHFGSGDSVAFKQPKPLKYNPNTNKYSDDTPPLRWDVYDWENETHIKLSQVMTPSKFRKIDSTGNYFSDGHNIYVFVTMLQNYPSFFFIPKEHGTIKGMNKDYLFTKNRIFYNGDLVRYASPDSCVLLTIKSQTTSKKVEILECNKRLYDGGVSMGKDQLDFLDLSTSQKKQLMKNYIIE